MDENQGKNISKPSRTTIAIVVIVVLLILAGLIYGIVTLASSQPEVTGQVRDIFLIVLALESLLVGVALIILVIQLAVLTNLIQNEVKPILATTKETVSTVKGTSKFISERAVKPIISVSSFFAGFQKLFEIIGFIKRKD